MSQLSPIDFAAFFADLWEHEPFPWQTRLLERVLDRGWPDYIDLPTASGKTATLDVAVFALAVQAGLPPEKRTLGRRIFFTVNRRVIVDEAFERAKCLANQLLCASADSITGRVANALRQVSGDPEAPPLDVALLRGGIVRDNRWARAITQPAIITSTIDQVGSRLLFRGYGVSEGARPLHAALIAHDSLLLLDEAHISQPFVETLNAIQTFRGAKWAKTPVQTPFAFVQLTATPGGTAPGNFTLDAEDLAHPVLQARHTRPKPVALHIAAGAKGKDPHPALAKELAERAVALLDDKRRNIAIVVNRVVTARLTADLLPDTLRKKRVAEADVHLAIGRMRPLDRDTLTKAIQARVGPGLSTPNDAPPMFVVATQCLEVGADFDFDGMVSECASIDALRQRFGRLNRRGRKKDALGVIVVRKDQAKECDDPIYGTALAKTWEWLQARKQNDAVDFGVRAMNSLLEDGGAAAMLAPRLHAPVMFPAYVDMWAQTSPPPAPSPGVALFIHGPQRGEPEVQVCWREDLDEGAEKRWVQVVSLLPPSGPECMTVPIGLVRRWLQGQKTLPDERGDLLDGQAPEDAGGTISPRKAVLWRGARDSVLAQGPGELRPGDTVVIPVHAEGWNVFGHVPEEAPKDLAEEARAQNAGMVALRMDAGLLNDWNGSEAAKELKAWLEDPEQNLRAGQLRTLLGKLAQEKPETQEIRARAMKTLASNRFGFEYERYPIGNRVVFRTTRPDKNERLLLPAMDDGDDRASALPAPIPLPEHLRHVVDALESAAARLPVAPWREALKSAAKLHDIGKADERFQAMLLRGNIHAAWARGLPLAKSGGVPMSRDEWRRAAERCGYPKGFRHEMLSVQLAERKQGLLPGDPLERDLALHLIASHHGRGRPFAPVVLDAGPPPVALEIDGESFALSSDERKENPPHRLDSGIAERFWKLTRQYGWWGLAYLEAVLRLADQRASQRESESTAETQANPPAEAMA